MQEACAQLLSHCGWTLLLPVKDPALSVWQWTRTHCLSCQTTDLPISSLPSSVAFTFCPKCLASGTTDFTPPLFTCGVTQNQGTVIPCQCQNKLRLSPPAPDFALCYSLVEFQRTRLFDVFEFARGFWQLSAPASENATLPVFDRQQHRMPLQTSPPLLLAWHQAVTQTALPSLQKRCMWLTHQMFQPMVTQQRTFPAELEYYALADRWSVEMESLLLLQRVLFLQPLTQTLTPAAFFQRLSQVRASLEKAGWQLETLFVTSGRLSLTHLQNQVNHLGQIFLKMSQSGEFGSKLRKDITADGISPAVSPALLHLVEDWKQQCLQILQTSSASDRTPSTPASNIDTSNFLAEFRLNLNQGRLSSQVLHPPQTGGRISRIPSKLHTFVETCALHTTPQLSCWHCCQPPPSPPPPVSRVISSSDTPAVLPTSQHASSAPLDHVTNQPPAFLNLKANMWQTTPQTFHLQPSGVWTHIPSSIVPQPLESPLIHPMLDTECCT